MQQELLWGWSQWPIGFMSVGRAGVSACLSGNVSSSPLRGNLFIMLTVRVGTFVTSALSDLASSRSWGRFSSEQSMPQFVVLPPN